ncbi:MAG TPA: hypothetical protein VHI93_02500, partial [Candidatus Thermoplasmatota archaeon]|nr:hypothetical protein [Candidatus Thermoplasmatota archaeon]
LPTPEAVQQIFRIHTAGMTLGADVDFPALVTRLKAISGADIQAICTEAGMRAIRLEHEAIAQEDFLAAVKKHEKGELHTGHGIAPSALYA